MHAPGISIAAVGLARSLNASGRDHRQKHSHPGPLAQVLVAKYADHLPLSRLAQIFGRAGLTHITINLFGSWTAL
jgi:transposase